ncbi:FAD/NAD(P)-binding domain-containing protein [Boletus reticuloceps]|uniref:FAD/NAD(P)-binding domain-containing protein n=1 Tax=Boletus reticuloceps TaxID=495285 RepID=A0A8I2YMI6_9AGAM|nr:FAD/NAD(P)-binding domain-containing protein [Boletus reticuloceps]
MRRVIGLVLLAGVAVASVQRHFSTLPFQESEAHEYQFEWPIQRVAVIGAGPSGLVAYRELTEAGLDVRLFERNSVPGGVWHYTEEVPLDAPVPNVPASIGDFVPSLPPAGVDLPYIEEFEDDGEIGRDHRGPKQLWESLTSNMPSFPQWRWPAGTPWELTHYRIRNYVRSYAAYLNINSNDENPATAYNTRVERVEKRINEAGKEHGWRLWLRSLEPTSPSGTYRATWWTEDFDAVVVAVGKYNAPSIPSIPGLEEWVQRFPGLVRHSRQYRRPEVCANQTVLIVGAGVSGTEISRDINRQARIIYQSFRPDKHNQTHITLESRLRRIPDNTTLVGEIEQFLPIPEGSPIQSGFVKLKNGTILSGIDSLILATGYRLSFPFLPQYYDGATYEPHPGSAPTVSPFLPVDGAYIRDLYLEQFYIRDPTLAFLGILPSYLSLDYTTLALAKVWTDTAKLPSGQAMWTWYNKAVEERRGYGKYFLFLSPQRLSARLAYMIGWLNEAASKYGGKQVDGIPKEYVVRM